MCAKIIYFIDLYQVIGNYGSCPSRKKKSKLDSYDIGVIWKYINNKENLNKAHNKMMETKAQTNIIISRSYITFINFSL